MAASSALPVGETGESGGREVFSSEGCAPVGAHSRTRNAVAPSARATCDRLAAFESDEKLSRGREGKHPLFPGLRREARMRRQPIVTRMGEHAERLRERRLRRDQSERSERDD